MLADSSLVQCTCTIIIIHTVRSCKWKAIMTIYDGLIEMIMMWYDRMVSSFKWIEWLDLAHVHACSWIKSTEPSWYLCSWWIISYSCLHSVLINFNACSWLLSLSSWSLPSLFLAFTCNKQEYCLCIHFHKPQSYSIWVHYTFLYAVSTCRSK